MPKFWCRCGNVMNLSNGWSDSEQRLVKEALIEKIGKQIDDAKMDCEKFYDTISENSTRVLICPTCNRIWVEGEHYRYRSYILEEENYFQTDSVNIPPVNWFKRIFNRSK